MGDGIVDHSLCEEPSTIALRLPSRSRIGNEGDSVRGWGLTGSLALIQAKIDSSSCSGIGFVTRGYNLMSSEFALAFPTLKWQALYFCLSLLIALNGGVGVP